MIIKDVILKQLSDFRTLCQNHKVNFLFMTEKGQKYLSDDAVDPAMI